MTIKAHHGSQALPSEDTCALANQLWRRIRTRFQLSTVWRAAPTELVATEFLSLLRFALAPIRVEAALFDATREQPLLAATLPPKVAPVAGDAVSTPLDLEFDSIEFFGRGGSAADEWIARFPPDAGPLLEVAKKYASYFSSFREAPEVYNVTHDGTVTLRLLADAQYDKARMRSVVDDADLPALLRPRAGGAGAFHGEWQPLHRRLSDHLLHDFIDRLENDLAISTGGDTPDIWVLLLDDQSERLQFHAPPQKLKRLLRYYGVPENDTPAVSALRQRVEQSDGDGQGDLATHLAPCHSGFHRYLSNAWDDDCELTVDHLECIAEKFKGWPVDRGIAGSIVSTGCGDVVRDFATTDYRVAAYSYAGQPSRIHGESDEFYRVRLAERVFIKISPHLVELPLLWGLDAEGRGRCAALLLVLFNGHHDGGTADDYFARRALAIRAAVEPWYLVFEQHARLMEWNAVIHGHIVHEARSAFQQVDRDLPDDGRSYLETRLQLLWSAYSFVRDNRGPRRSQMTITEFTAFVKAAAHDVIAGDGRFDYRLSSVAADDASGISVEVGVELVRLLLRGFLEESVADLGNLEAKGLQGDRSIEFRMVSNGTTQGEEQLILEIEHRVSPGVARFVKEHGPLLGRAPIFTDNRQRAHLGLFYVGVLLRGCGGEFVRPTLHKDSDRVTWKFAFRSRRAAPTPLIEEDAV